jgi:hypothetical protein
MEDDLPPELRQRRQAIYEHVTRRGRARRYRRLGAVTLAVALLMTAPIAALALTRADRSQQVSTVDPPTTSAVGTTSTTPISPSSTAPSTAPITTAPPSSTTTTLVCRNGTNPACGPMSYDPPIMNQPATLAATAAPATPTAGETVTFTVHASDPDSFIDPGGFCGQISFGEGNTTACTVACAPTGPQYGPWAPPPPKPGDATFTFTHTYPRAGTYTASFSLTAEQCGPRPSPASTSITLHITS